MIFSGNVINVSVTKTGKINKMKIDVQLLFS